MADHDIELYEHKMRELEHLKDHIKKTMQNEDKYMHPLIVLDTDYDNYLITYRCSEVNRLHEEDDDMNEDFEKFRKLVEEEGKGIEHLHALEAIEEYFDDSQFQSL